MTYILCTQCKLWYNFVWSLYTYTSECVWQSSFAWHFLPPKSLFLSWHLNISLLNKEDIVMCSLTNMSFLLLKLPRLFKYIFKARNEDYSVWEPLINKAISTFFFNSEISKWTKAASRKYLISANTTNKVHSVSFSIKTQLPRRGSYSDLQRGNHKWMTPGINHSSLGFDKTMYHDGKERFILYFLYKFYHKLSKIAYKGKFLFIE